ncbi:tail fiber domain-containing protein [Flavobacterium procerum]|uniref:Tail fiber domain-containing protein n=1 Tax=Flavobacterium procerum TaxID=1455569 RepID=A0ABV6BLU2_9FLAO
MRKITLWLILIQSGLLMAQTKTVVSPYGEKITIHPNANNGLTPNNGNIQLGGTLTEPNTTITASANNTLSIKGLDTGQATDNLILTDDDGIVKNIKAAALPMWFITGNGNTDAATNFLGTTDDVDLVFKRNTIPSGRLGINNTTFGANTFSNATISNAVAIGANAMKNATGNYSVAIGNQTLMNSTGSSNTAIGYAALSDNTSGYTNTGIARGALAKNTTGTSNTAIGYNSLNANTTANFNTAIGYVALSNNIDSAENVAVGSNSMVSNISSSFNTAVGSNALNAYAGGTGATYNVALGSRSLGYLTGGINNVALGSRSGAFYGTGTTNNLTTADTSVFIGYVANPQANAQTNQIVIGYNSVGRGSNTVQIGNSTMTSIGGQVGWSFPSDVRLKKDIQDSPFGLNFITKLRPVVYHMKTGTTDLQTGFIAQEVEKATNSLNYDFNAVVKPQTNAENDYYSLRYAEFVVPLVKAVQEQQAQIEKQQNELAAKDNDIKNLNDRVAILEKAMAKISKM